VQVPKVLRVERPKTRRETALENGNRREGCGHILGHLPRLPREARKGGPLRRRTTRPVRPVLATVGPCIKTPNPWLFGGFVVPGQGTVERVDRHGRDRTL